MLEINNMQNNVLEKIKGHQTQNIKITVSKDREEVKLKTSLYSIDILISPKWIGYEFRIDKKLTKNIPLGDYLDTDLYSLDYDVNVSKEIYDELITFLEDLLSNKLYYGLKGNSAVFAKPAYNNKKNEYELSFHPRGIFGKGILTHIKKEYWQLDRLKNDEDMHAVIANKD